MTEVRRNSPRAWLLAARPKTLTGAVSPVMVATALAATTGAWSGRAALTCLVFACLMQVAANFINDLYDFLRGTDRADRLGPERACQQGWISPRAMRRGIAVVLVAAAVCGLQLLGMGSPVVLLSTGAACMVFAFLYTTWLSYRGWGDVLVLLFFGWVPVVVTYYVETGCVSWSTFALGTAVGIVTDTLLVVNNYRDRDTDRCHGKRTLIVWLGERFGRWFYLGLGFAACLLSVATVSMTAGWGALLPLAYLPLHIGAWRCLGHIREGRALNGVLGVTARNIFLLSLLISVALIARTPLLVSFEV